MADNKLAAGRKMLLEFQKRKTDKKHTSSTDTPVTVEEPTIPKMEPVNDVQFTTQEIVQASPTPGDIFFKEFSSKHQDQQNAPIESGLPLAGRLFTSKSNGGNEFLQNNSQTSENVHSTNDSAPINVSYIENLETQHTANNTVDSGEVQDIRTMVEISKLRQQLQFHIKTVEFLVSEKNSLCDKVNECEKIIDDLKTQTTDLTGRLNISRHRVSHLETECSQLKQKNEAAETQMQALINDSINHQSIESTYKKQLQDVQEELQEMKTLVDDKVSDYKLLLKKFQEVNTQLQSNELRLQQVIQGNGQTSQNTSLQEHCHNLEQMINTLRQQLSQAEAEKNHSSLHYQQYVHELNNQVQMLNEKQEELIYENERLQNREESLLQQMGSLEKQLQSTLTQNIPQGNNKNNLQLDEKVQALEMEISQLQVELQSCKSSLEVASQEINKKQEEVEELTSTLQRIQSESPDVTKLNAAIESDRLAAQKATAQNTKMKIDLQHLEKAFEQMTNSKLELAELLQAEKNLSKNVTLKLVETEGKLKDVESKLMAKDEEMIRLQAASSELEKDVLKYAQITDRISHYEAQGKSLDLVQAELQSAKNTIQILTNENQKLKKQNIQNNIGHNENDNNNEEQTTHHTMDSNGSDENSHNDDPITNIPTADAMDKLQEKFTKLIKEVADLSDEKQKLEHIVLQLQSETETICEYIALYQKQRGILKQREAERNAQLNMLSVERENMKRQLESLKTLIMQLHNNVNNSGDTRDENPTIVSKIMDLVTEIKGNHLIEPNDKCSNLENFHHCPWCSGKLITV